VGIISLLLSLAWLIQLFGNTIHTNSEPILPFLDTIFLNLASGNISFLATILYGLMVLNMLACLIKGNVVFGIKIPYVIAFHPLQVNKTYLNSLLFNTSVMMLTSLSIVEMTMITFPAYLGGSYLGRFFNN